MRGEDVPLSLIVIKFRIECAEFLLPNENGKKAQIVKNRNPIFVTLIL
jgi:hypothetical protein